MRPRKSRGSGHERVDEILAAARALFLDEGFENVSTRRIAKRAGISQTTLFLYYRTKDEILDRLKEAAFVKLGMAIRTIDRDVDSPEDYFRAVIPEYIRFGLRYPDEYRLAFLVREAYRKPINSTHLETPGIAMGLDVFQGMQARVGQAAEAGLMRQKDVPVNALAQSIWAAMHGLVALVIARPGFAWADEDVLVHVHTEMLLAGLFERTTRLPDAFI